MNKQKEIDKIQEAPKSKLWKKPNYLLNRSRNWPAATSYQDARDQAIAANIEVQRRVVR